jgi:hypothetical protein
MVDRFADDRGGFFATADDADPLIVRPKNTHDNPTPSDNALAAEAIVTLAAYTGDPDLYGRFERTVESVGPSLTTHPWAHGHLLGVWIAGPALEVAVVGKPEARRPFLDIVWGRFRPDAVVASGDGFTTTVPLLDGRTPAGGARAFVCRGFVCDIPAESPEDLAAQLDRS